MWADSFDSADGQLARMTKQYSRIGRILDGLSGDLGLLPSMWRYVCARMSRVIFQRSSLV